MFFFTKKIKEHKTKIVHFCVLFRNNAFCVLFRNIAFSVLNFRVFHSVKKMPGIGCEDLPLFFSLSWILSIPKSKYMGIWGIMGDRKNLKKNEIILRIWQKKIISLTETLCEHYMGMSLTFIYYLKTMITFLTFFDKKPKKK